jgi:hypothetical protein
MKIPFSDRVKHVGLKIWQIIPHGEIAASLLDGADQQVDRARVRDHAAAVVRAGCHRRIVQTAPYRVWLVVTGASE